MADEIKDDEYHFSDDQGGDIFDEESSSNSASGSSGGNIMSKITNLMAGDNLKRTIMLGIGAVIVLIILVKIVGTFGGNKAKTQTVAKAPAITEPAPTPASTPKVTEVSNKDFDTPAPIQSVKSDPDVNRKLSMLQRGNDTTTRKITSINNNVEGLQTGINSLGTKITMLNQSIAMLSEQVRIQQMQIAKLKEKPKPKKIAVKDKMPKTTYTIQAVIPGRAWLMSSGNKTITVRVGSRIPGYGRVKHIDAHQGVVYLDGDKTIIFSASDS